jgi:hypothetical protein
MENKETKSRKRPKGSWKFDLMEGLLELVVTLVLTIAAMAVGYLLLSVYPKEKLANIDGELVVLIGTVVLAIPVGLVILICNLIKKKRGRKMVNSVYKALKNKYSLKTVTLTRKLHEEYTDVYILKGESQKGKFELYRDGLDLVFAPEGAGRLMLASVDEAISKIEEFMEVQC